MTNFIAKTAFAAALTMSTLAFSTSAIADEAGAQGPKDGTVHCTVTKDGFNWNTCPSKERRRKQINAPGAAPAVPNKPGEEPVRFSVFGFSIESEPAPFEPDSAGHNVDGGGGTR